MVLPASSRYPHCCASRSSLAYDQGREITHHDWLRKRPRPQTYFADLRSPRQRGPNENANDLRRQNSSRNTNLVLSQRQLNTITNRLNG